MPNAKMFCKSGEDFIRNSNCVPAMKTKKGWELEAKRRANKMSPKGFWHGVVADTGFGFFRMSFAGRYQYNESVTWKIPPQPNQ